MEKKNVPNHQPDYNNSSSERVKTALAAKAPQPRSATSECFGRLRTKACPGKNTGKQGENRGKHEKQLKGGISSLKTN
jgi:hypothetical protein